MKKHSKTIMSALIPACVLLLSRGQPAPGEVDLGSRISHDIDPVTSSVGTSRAAGQTIITEIIGGGLSTTAQSHRAKHDGVRRNLNCSKHLQPTSTTALRVVPGIAPTNRNSLCSLQLRTYRANNFAL